ncbi:hypothetical protein WJX72_003427 [[Myrmecia] bisecta]|uniref:LHY n=1 Tax=[Myrmecia] bisecta TaxID=41462 RepID=A0AAW1Q4H1_9CHLO
MMDFAVDGPGDPGPGDSNWVSEGPSAINGGLADATSPKGNGEKPQKPKVRKQYTISKQRERWTDEEHNRFLDALKLYGRAWRRIEEHIGTKTAVQIRSHAQKFFAKLEKEQNAGLKGEGLPEDLAIPPPRPKRKPAHPYPKKANGSVASGLEHAPSMQISNQQQQQQQQQVHFPDFAAMAADGEVGEATVAAVAAAASAAAAAAAAAVVAAAGEQVQAQLQASPPQGFPFFGLPPSMLATLGMRSNAVLGSLRASGHQMPQHHHHHHRHHSHHQHPQRMAHQQPALGGRRSGGQERTATSEPGVPRRPPLAVGRGSDGDSACSAESSMDGKEATRKMQGDAGATSTAMLRQQAYANMPPIAGVLVDQPSSSNPGHSSRHQHMPSSSLTNLANAARLAERSSKLQREMQPTGTSQQDNGSDGSGTDNNRKATDAATTRKADEQHDSSKYAKAWRAAQPAGEAGEGYEQPIDGYDPEAGEGSGSNPTGNGGSSGDGSNGNANGSSGNGSGNGISVKDSNNGNGTSGVAQVGSCATKDGGLQRYFLQSSYNPQLARLQQQALMQWGASASPFEVHNVFGNLFANMQGYLAQGSAQTGPVHSLTPIPCSMGLVYDMPKHEQMPSAAERTHSAPPAPSAPAGSQPLREIREDALPTPAEVLGQQGFKPYRTGSHGLHSGHALGAAAMHQKRPHMTQFSNLEPQRKAQRTFPAPGNN